MVINGLLVEINQSKRTKNELSEEKKTAEIMRENPVGCLKIGQKVHDIAILHQLQI